MNNYRDAVHLDLVHEGTTYPRFTIAQLEAAGIPEPVILAAVKADLRARIDEAAERARAPWITPGVGQSMEYDKVEQQADAALKAQSTASAARYPMLAATIGIDIDPQTGEAATDVLGVARSVQAARDAWTAKGAEIRTSRLKAKAAIAEAGSIEAAVAATGSVSWPRPPG